MCDKMYIMKSMYKLTRVQFDILENLIINVSDKKIIEDILLKKYSEEVIKKNLIPYPV